MNFRTIALICFIFVSLIVYSDSKFDSEDLFKTNSFMAEIFRSKNKIDNAESPNKSDDDDDEDDFTDLKENNYHLLGHIKKEGGIKYVNLTTKDYNGTHYINILFQKAGYYFKENDDERKIKLFINEKGNDISFKTRFKMLSYEYKNGDNYSLYLNSKGNDYNRVLVYFKIEEQNLNGTEDQFDEYIQNRKNKSTYTTARRSSYLYYDTTDEAREWTGIWCRSDREEYGKQENLGFCIKNIDADHDKFFTRHPDSKDVGEVGGKTHRGEYHANVFGLIDHKITVGDKTVKFPLFVMNEHVEFKIAVKTIIPVVTCGGIIIGFTAITIIMFYLSDKYFWKDEKAGEALTKFEQEEKKLKAKEEAGQAAAARESIGLNSSSRDSKPEDPKPEEQK